MKNYSLFGCNEEGSNPRVCSNCSTDEPNRIVHLALVKNGSVVVETGVGIVNSLLALEKTCEAVIIRNVNGTMAEAAYQSGKGAGKQISRILSGTHSISITDFDMVNNIEFWNGMISSAKNYTMYFFTSTMAWVVKKPLTISPSVPITDALDTFIEGMVKIDWSQKGLPTTLVAGEINVDKLDECKELFESELTNEVGSDATISADGYGISVLNADTVDCSLTSDVPIDGITIIGVVPTGLTVTVSQDKLKVRIVGVPTVSAISSIDIIASNACGMSAEFTISFEVV